MKFPGEENLEDDQLNDESSNTETFLNENTSFGITKRNADNPPGTTKQLKPCFTRIASADEDCLQDECINSRSTEHSSVAAAVEEETGVLNNIIIKRPRGRPPLAKKIPGTVDAANANNGANKGPQNELKSTDSSNQEEETDKMDDGGIMEVRQTFVEKKKLGKGRPRGSLNKKGRKDLKRKRGESFNGVSTRSHSNIEDSMCLNENLNTNSKEIITKRGRGRPPGSKNKTKTVKLLPKRSSVDLAYTIIKNVEKTKKDAPKNKQNDQPANVRKIPKHRLDEALTMLSNSEHSIWEDRNTSCNKSIHRHWDDYTVSNHNLRLKFARQFLMRRDWVNLSKVLSIASQDIGFQYIYYPLLAKYASLCLAHTDKQKFNKFVQFLVRTEDGGKVLKKCTNVKFSENYSEDEDGE